MSNGNYMEQRPWGSYEILSQFPVLGEGLRDSCVKRITVRPGQRLSLQAHRQRAEHWFVVQGQGQAEVDGRIIPLQPGRSLDIPIGARHRAANTGAELDLVFIEVQSGHSDESDIERFEDDYGRA
ncbi:MAG TPA: phosphomannose isomerase type II C-terminal cupin domain [Patescibacteria group bacterium]|nr:phosphomannose isomerase type II C-terminal cupin domain [Patescibacteria group bacterium]